MKEQYLDGWLFAGGILYGTLGGAFINFPYSDSRMPPRTGLRITWPAEERSVVLGLPLGQLPEEEWTRITLTSNL